MTEKNDIYHSVLIVSSSETFASAIKNSLTGFWTADHVKNVSLARRFLLERYFDLIVINAPLTDENGESFAMDAAETSNASVLVVAPRETFEDVLEKVTDFGILVFPKPSPRGRIGKAIRFLTAVQNRMHSLERKTQAAEEKINELRIIDRAKFLLMEQRHMTEDEAHRLIGKKAMDSGISRGKAARRILDEME